MEMDYQERDSYKKIVKSATMLFSTKGYRGTTIKDITAGAGLAVGTFYLYFKSKQELYASIMEDFAKGLQKHLDGCGAGIEDVVERQVQYIISFIRYAFENLACYNLIFESLYIDKKLFFDYYHKYAMRYVPFIAKSPDMSKEIDPAVWSYISMGIGNFLGFKVIAEGDCSEEQLKIIENTIRKILTEGILAD